MCVALLDVVAFLLAAAPEIMQIDQGLYGVAITAFVTVIHVASSPKYVFELKKNWNPTNFCDNHHTLVPPESSHGEEVHNASFFASLSWSESQKKTPC